MFKPTLTYCIPYGPPILCVLMVAQALNVELIHRRRKPLNVPSFNANRDSPTLTVEHDRRIESSYAISLYLIERYATRKDATRSLYPRGDEMQCAQIRERLHFGFSQLCPLARDLYLRFVYGATEVPSEKVVDAHRMYEMLAAFLSPASGGGQWLAGASMTVADLSTIATVTQIRVHVPMEEVGGRWAVVIAWMERFAEEYPELAQINAHGLAEYKKKIADANANAESR